MTAHALVIDARPDVRRLLEIKLSHAGFTVTTAVTGADGLARAHSDKPHIVIVDAHLPGVDGYTVTARVKEALWPATPVIIMLSALGRPADIARGLAAGADDYVVTPFAPREILERVVVALVRRGREDLLPATLQLERPWAEAAEVAAHRPGR